MARVRPLIVARKLSGYVVPNAEVYIYERDDTEVVADHAKVELDLYTTEAGGTTIAQPLHTDSRGIAEEFWVAPTSYDRRIVSALDDFIVHDEALTAQDLGGRELGYAEITSNASVTATSATDLVGLSVDVEAIGRPLRVIFDAQRFTESGASQAFVIELAEDGTTIAVVQIQNNASTAGLIIPLHREARRVPSAGTHTYKVRAYVTAGTGTIVATAPSPCFIQVVEA